MQQLAVDFDRAKWVRPEIGSGGDGHTFPGATYPFGLVQPSPDTGREGYRYCSGYRYEDDRIFGFSQTHLSGTGCGDLGDLRIMPFAGKASSSVSSAFRKETQVCEPGYYAVTLDDPRVRAEAAAAPHCAIYRFTYPSAKAALLVDCQWGIGGRDFAKTILECDARVEDGRLKGTTVRRHWVKRQYSYVVEFDHPVVSHEKLPAENSEEKGPRFALEFDLSDGRPLVVKIGYSLVGVDGAEKNLAAELPDFDFDRIRAAALAEWDKTLSRMEVKGSDTEKINFFSAMYRLFIQPNNIADVDGRYRGADGEVHVAQGAFIIPRFRFGTLSGRIIRLRR